MRWLVKVVAVFPADVGVIDLMIGFPSADARQNYRYIRDLTKDAESASMEFPAQYMFKDVPNHREADDDAIAITVAQMDRFGIDRGLISITSAVSLEAVRRHPDRFVTSLEVDPNDISSTVRSIRDAHRDHGIVAVSTFPAGCNPQVPISDRRYYPIYQTCVDLGLPIIVNAGIAGPRVPSACQDVMHFDQVCYDFPELCIVMRHGAEPWEELAVKLMIKWPGLYYMTSAFAPRYYPRAIVDYANTRGANKILYAGYYPMGLSLERIFTELPAVGFKEDVWPKFLRHNAISVFGLTP